MDGSTDRFEIYGPTQFMGAGAAMIDWGNEEHRRVIIASLVNGIYVLENDRAKSRAVALAPAWYQSFGFGLKKPLTEGYGFNNTSIFGAIYEYVHVPRHPSAPRYVVAFRGTMLRLSFDNMEVTKKDLGLDGKILFTKSVEFSSRSRLARQDADQLMKDQASPGPETCVEVWLAGHSLGASLALDVGRYMMVSITLNLPTFLFNLPNVSFAPLLKLLQAKHGKAKRDLYYTTYFFKVGTVLLLAPLFGSHWKRMRKLYEQLSPWVPNLYVNEKDVICQGYIDYFMLRQQFEERFRGIRSWSSEAKIVSFRNMLFYMIAKLSGTDKERLNVLPSATILKNKTQSFLGAHGLKHWWKPNVELELNSWSFRNQEQTAL
ncbi:hypothetical protein ACQ4PT_040900 [Festuca glaucescens]